MNQIASKRLESPQRTKPTVSAYGFGGVGVGVGGGVGGGGGLPTEITWNVPEVSKAGPPPRFKPPGPGEPPKVSDEPLTMLTICRTPGAPPGPGVPAGMIG